MIFLTFLKTNGLSRYPMKSACLFLTDKFFTTKNKITQGLYEAIGVQTWD